MQIAASNAQVAAHKGIVVPVGGRPIDYSEVEQRISALFQDNVRDTHYWPFIVEIFGQCVLGQVLPAEPPLNQRWVSPGGCYRGQWIWDTMFVVDLLSLLPEYKPAIREVFQNYWDFQNRWNQVAPEHAQGMIACMIEPGNDKWREFPAYSQIPILAWGLERVYSRNGDIDLVQSSLDALERFHEWYWRERDVRDQGLVGVGAYSGVVQHARFETFDCEANLDDLQLTDHPSRASENGPWYGDISVPGLTSYLILAEQSLARLSEIAGNCAMAERRRARARRAILSMRTRMWDDDHGTFLAIHRDSGQKIAVPTIGSWMPFIAQVPAPAMARRMADVLSTPRVDDFSACSHGRPQ